MVPRGLAKRYATALFNAAVRLGIEETVRDEAAGFRSLFRENGNFRSFLLSPQVLTSDKKDLIDKSFAGRASELLVRFLQLLIDKKRFFFVVEIIDAYEHLYERHKGIIEVRAVTAIPLDEELRQKTVEKLEGETGKKIKLKPMVDPDIVGGMVLIMEDKIIDGSIRHYLETVRRDLREIRID